MPPAAVSYPDLAHFDDLLVDCLVDRILYWDTARKVRDYKPIRGVSENLLIDIIRDELTNSEKPSVIEAMKRFRQIPSIKTYSHRFQNQSVIQQFERHIKRYFAIYSLDSGFDIEVTDRYMSRSKRTEACVIARKHFEPGQKIEYLYGTLAELNNHDEQELNKGRDFSIINSSRRGANCLMLGPARFVNHNCDANARFVSAGWSMTIYAQKPIQVGEEITVEYSKNYFGTNNQECLCTTCEKHKVNGFAVVPNPTLLSDSDSSLTPIPSPTRSSSHSPSSTPLSTSIEPEPQNEAEKRSLRPRKSMEPKTKQQPRQVHSNELNPKAIKEFMRAYYSEPFDTDPAKTLSCLNCDVPFIHPEDRKLTKTNLTRRFCPRCHRHSVLYNAYWPSSQAEQDLIDLYVDRPALERAIKEQEERRRQQQLHDSSSDDEDSGDGSHRRSRRTAKRKTRVFLPAVPDTPKKEPRKRSMSVWLQKRIENNHEPLALPEPKRRRNRTKSMPTPKSQPPPSPPPPDPSVSKVRIRRPTWKKVLNHR
ncbi:hypothetical protein TRICI_000393 [Trichomonascus ciferrii]|uniref:Histone-lysine N-methyltransferase SET9 n=1 Tax=Trichomonascus ciferrii TaxID=44093 RepID=A0A642VDI0_9ASCO|nr:hypothetical protein TRICI_000393 [Trichomonascus ciferrii]